MQSRKRIAPEIKSAHSRVADAYGIAKIGETERKPGYSTWNFNRNVEEPIRSIVAKYYHGGPILDAGCGNGQISQVFASCGVSGIIGVDFSEKMLTAALRRAELFKTTLFSPVCADLENLDFFKSESFEITFLFGVIEHLDNPALVLENLFRLTKPGGVMVIGVPRKYSPAFFTYLLSGQSPNRWGTQSGFRHWFNFREKLNYYRFYTPRQIRAFLEFTSLIEICERIPLGFIHLDGVFGKLLNRIGVLGSPGYRILDTLNTLFGNLHFIPVGELWIVRKKTVRVANK